MMEIIKSLETLIGTFYLSCAPAWFTGNGRLDDAKVEAFLSALKGIRGNWTYESSVQKTGWDYESMGQRPQWNPYNTNLIGRYGTWEEGGGGELMIQGLQKQLPFLLRGGDNITLPVGMLADVKPNDFAALPGQSEGCYVPTLIMGVNKATTHSEVAIKFIAHALSAEAQYVDLWEGLPVNKGAQNAMLSKESTSSGAITGGMNWSGRWPDQAQCDQLRGIINELKTPVIPDTTLYQMIVSESTPFFEGKIDAKQAAANVCAKANAYLWE